MGFSYYMAYAEIEERSLFSALIEFLKSLPG